MANTEAGPVKLLFVCSRNEVRSLTAEKLFEASPLYHARSVGTQPNARIVITEGHLGWADFVFFMEKSHLNRARLRFPDALAGRQVITLHIPDEYTYMQDDLVDELLSKLSPHVAVPMYDHGHQVPSVCVSQDNQTDGKSMIRRRKRRGAAFF